MVDQFQARRARSDASNSAFSRVSRGGRRPQAQPNSPSAAGRPNGTAAPPRGCAAARSRSGGSVAVAGHRTAAGSPPRSVPAPANSGADRDSCDACGRRALPCAAGVGDHQQRRWERQGSLVPRRNAPASGGRRQTAVIAPPCRARRPPWTYSGRRSRCRAGRSVRRATTAAGDAGQRVVGDVHVQTGLLGDQPVQVAQQGAAAGQHDAALGHVRAQFGRVCSSAERTAETMPASGSCSASSTSLS